MNERAFTLFSTRLSLACIGLVLITASVFGESLNGENEGSGTTDEPYIVPRTESHIRVDAILDEAAWEQALILELNYEVRPGENIPPPVRTEVLLTYDMTRFYAAFRCYDPDPSAISAHLSDRDNVGPDDWVGLILDTFNDERRSFDLLVNPLGIQMDFIETQKGEGSWDAIWESAGQITDWGYVVELSIQFKQLRLQRTDTPQIWGFDAVRSYPRSQRHHIGAFPRDRNNNCYLCQAIKIMGYEGVSSGRNLEITPTVIGVQSDARKELPGGKLEMVNQETDFGLTAKWGLTPNLTLSGTLNPDFSQVEADALKLDINQPFALYYPERRPFFTEGTDFFRTLKSVIYTRTVRDPSLGLKLTGKEDAHTIGTYVVRDDLTNLIFPGSEGSSSTSLSMPSTAAVFRYKRDIGSKYTTGALLTDREGENYHNRVLGLDGDFRFTQTDQIQVQLLSSNTSYTDEVAEEFSQPDGNFSDRFIAFEYDHSTRNNYWWLDYDEVGPDFRADLGFIPMVGFRNVEGGGHHTWWAEPNNWWARVSAGVEFFYYDTHEGELLHKGAAAWMSYNGALQSWFQLSASRFKESYNDAVFDLSSYKVVAGLRPTSDLGLSFFSLFGDRIDYANTRKGQRILLGPSIDYNLGAHLRLSLDHTFERMTVKGGRLYTANISRLSTVYQFNTRFFLRSILQFVDYRYNTELYTYPVEPEEQHLYSQILLSYKINPFTVLFIGYSDNYDGSREYNLTQRDRSIFVKVGYAWLP